MESHGSQRSTRLKRKPLSDLTNTTKSSPSLLKPESKPNWKPKAANPNEAILRSDAAVCGSGPDRGMPTTSTPRAKDPSRDSVLSESQIDKSVISTSKQEKTFRRKRTRKGVLLGQSSCPPVGRIKSSEGKRMFGEDNFGRPLAFSVPCEKAKKRQRRTMTETLNKPLLPQDFVEKQRAYFAEIDSFELPEEVVSESELD
ncbi:uncharacterized protein [Typha angustifolia]|uniref:uncharacterized protein isoform X1 n=1 Tax=Typha angustifolia TaxID=59011 RepID=UPI003C30DF75